MVAPKKMIMGRGESAVSIGRARSIARKPVVKVKPKTKTKVAEPKSNVKKDKISSKSNQATGTKYKNARYEELKSGAFARSRAESIKKINAASPVKNRVIKIKSQ